MRNSQGKQRKRIKIRRRSNKQKVDECIGVHYSDFTIVMLEGRHF